ncbi:uncharacterized protein LOC109949626 [Prunus persica]|uniref:uncharacterized protein LOC109949626 n=1 Tax=Prunus persica TaxID=3760 RepID=UPI0009AB636C|nr:uncharacterized protein LOC109949626 [Prunus persica]
MAGNNDDNRALEDYAQPVIPNSPSCILLPTEARNYDLKSSHFHMLPSFYGLPNEDPLAHIKEFYNVVSGLPLQGVTEANMRMRVASLEKKLNSMLNMVPKIAEVCAICNIPGHPTYQCSASEAYPEFIQEQVNLINSYNQMPRNDPFSNTYNPDWRDHPNLSWKNNNQFQNFQPKPATTLEDTVKMLAQNTVQFQQTTNSTLQQHSAALTKMETQLGQIADALSQREPGIFPSQPVILQRNQEQAKAVITLRSGKVINNGVGNEVTNEYDHVSAGPTQEENKKPNDDPSNAISSFEAPNFHKAEQPYSPPIPFPGRLAKSKQDKNMPLYGKFFKELNTYKRKYGPNEKVVVFENVSAVLQRKLPPKLKDPGSFSINITIGDKLVEKAMLDLGASINLMPYSLYLQLGLGGLKATTISLQLADRSVKYPRGIVEDILVQVDKLILPADFVVLDMEEAPLHDRELPILLGRPFMATAKTIIDVQNGLLTITVLGETVQFKVFESLSHPSSSIDCCSIDVLDSLVFSKFLLAQSNDPL